MNALDVLCVQLTRDLLAIAKFLYEVGLLAVDGWVVTFGTERRGLGGLRPR